MRKTSVRKTRIALCLTILAALVGYWYVGSVFGQEATDEGTTITLSRKLSSAVADIITPADVQPTRNRWEGRSGRATVTIEGRDMLVQVQNNTIGLDIDGDGSIGAREWTGLSNQGEAAFKIPVDTGDSSRREHIGVVMHDVIVHANRALVGRIAPASCMEGRYLGQYIRLFDDNLDGQFTLDGNDAIAIGSTAAAVPLLATHRIGNSFCRVQVAADGSSATFTPLTDVVVAQVKVPVRSNLLAAMVLSDGQQAYDLTTTNQIPPGRYQLVYGLLKSGRTNTPMMPSASALTYDIQAGMINTIQIGPPLWISFRAVVSGNTFKIGPPLTVYGTGGEQYEVSFDSGGNASLPIIRASVDGTVMASQSMEYG